MSADNPQGYISITARSQCHSAAPNTGSKSPEKELLHPLHEGLLWKHQKV